MFGRPRVLYYGPVADRVSDRWAERVRPFDLRCVAAPADPDELLADDYDGLVCHGDAAVVRPIVDRADELHDEVTLVVFETGTPSLEIEALGRGVNHYVSVDETFDPVEALEALEPVIEADRERRREQTMLDSLLEHIPLSIYFKDRRSRHIRASEELTALGAPESWYIENEEGKRHHTAADVLGKTDFDLYTVEHATNAVADDKEVMDTEEPVRNRIEGPFDEPRPQTYVSTSKAPWYDESGEVVGVLGVTQNVSERKRYERRLEAQNERLERFTSVVSHDLRNPLGVALGRLDAARETGDPEQFDAIEHALERMDSLIEDLLTLTRDDDTVADPDVVALEPIATNAWDVIPTDDATLVVTTDATLLADGSRLRQLFENLFRNAVEHAADDGGVTVTVGELHDGEGFFVADDGPGIPEAEREKVFRSGYTTSEQGTGLGLTIVAEIADAHGWSVDLVDSEAGGARFEFTGVERPS